MRAFGKIIRTKQFKGIKKFSSTAFRGKTWRDRTGQVRITKRPRNFGPSGARRDF